MLNNLVEGNLDFQRAYYQPVVKSFALSKDRIFELHKKAVKRFYLRPKCILKTLFCVGSFAEFKNYFRAGINLLINK